jgi:hypothetical protein
MPSSASDARPVYQLTKRDSIRPWYGYGRQSHGSDQYQRPIDRLRRPHENGDIRTLGHAHERSASTSIPASHMSTRSQPEKEEHRVGDR